MKFDFIFTGYSKIANRIIMIFFWCAMVPIGTLSFFSYNHITDQLYQQSQRRLKQATKTMGLNVYERLLLLETDLTIVASVFRNHPEAAVQIQPEDTETRVEVGFIAMAAITVPNKILPIYGEMHTIPELTQGEESHLNQGKTALLVDNQTKPYARLFMIRLVDPQNPAAGKLIGEVDALRLWGIGHANSLPPFVELTVVDHNKNTLVSSIDIPDDFIKKIKYTAKDTSSLQLEWHQNGSIYLSTTWSVFLKPVFYIPEWTVVMTQSKDEMFGPVEKVQQTFLLVILVSLLIVALLSIHSIRKSLVPIQELKQQTVQIAGGDYHSRVDVATGDEIQDLAESFNTMAGQLGRQFGMLTAMTDITNAVLALTETEKIIGTTLARIHDVFPCDKVIVCLKSKHKINEMTAYIGTETGKPAQKDARIALSMDDTQLLNSNPDFLLFYMKDEVPEFLSHFNDGTIRLYLVLPILTDGTLSGLIAAGYTNPRDINMKEIPQYRQLTDQVAVALSNAKLINDLKQLNLGALTALARTVDAKSPWTAGHSERVTELSVKVGQLLNLNTEQLEILTRAALLHDIGKIGVPAQILDKKERLSGEEYERIQTHSRAGARILEPIAAYKDAIPIVLQHHERFDGNGYPNGLRGETISLGARIIAVCDTFDAMASDRPYRDGIPTEKVLETIKEGAGKQFDPNVVEAFLQVIG